MKRSLMAALAALVALTAWSPRARADITLQDFGVNVNGTAYDYNNLGQTDPTTLSGMDASAFSTFTSGNGMGTGLGTLVFTFNPGAAGSYFVNFYFDESAGAPFFNEYGTVNGSAPAGMAYEIAEVNPSVGGIQFYNGATEVLPNALDNSNHVPVGNPNFLHNCTAVPCNEDVATALGFDFTLTAGQEAVMTVAQSTTNPGGFNLEQVHPVDPGNPTATDLFLDGSISIQPTGISPAPEPGTLTLYVIGMTIILAYHLRRRFAKS